MEYLYDKDQIKRYLIRIELLENILLVSSRYFFQRTGEVGRVTFFSFCVVNDKLDVKWNIPRYNVYKDLAKIREGNGCAIWDRKQG